MSWPTYAANPRPCEPEPPDASAPSVSPPYRLPGRTNGRCRWCPLRSSGHRPGMYPGVPGRRLDWPRSRLDEDNLVLIGGWRDAGVELGIDHRQETAKAGRGGRHLEQLAGDDLVDHPGGQVRGQPDPGH